MEERGSVIIERIGKIDIGDEGRIKRIERLGNIRSYWKIEKKRLGSKMMDYRLNGIDWRIRRNIELKKKKKVIWK